MNNIKIKVLINTNIKIKAPKKYFFLGFDERIVKVSDRRIGVCYFVLFVNLWKRGGCQFSQ